jgi:hypothetical protein
VNDATDVTIEFDEGSPDAPLTPGVSRIDPFCERGLVIVDAVTRWGVIKRGSRETAWATLPLSG